MAPKLYPVLSPITAGKSYKIGDSIPLEDDQVAELTFYGAIGEATGDAPVSGKLKADEAIAQIKVAATIEEIDTIVGSDNRATVIAAATARKSELAA